MYWHLMYAQNCLQTRLQTRLQTYHPELSNETDLTIYPRKHCRKQDAAAGGPGTAAHARTNIQNNSFIIPFISIHLWNNFYSLYILLPSYFRYALTDCNTPSPTCAFCNNFLFSWVDTFGFPIFLTVSW